MSQSNNKTTKSDLDGILSYVDQTKGLSIKVSEVGRVSILQDSDGKVFSFDTRDVVEVLNRQDSDSRPFVQLNFQNNHKVLLTENLIGFKPQETLGLDMGRIPKV